MTGKPTYLFADEVDRASLAARRIVPRILEVLGPVNSVVDLGGGTGAWLREFQNHGVRQVLLVDCPEARPLLLIDPAAFRACDLNRTLPTLSGFDLAVCVECAEHLRPDRAEPLVACLTAAADLVVFSAAIPWQGGKGHVNEKLADYWKCLFARHGFTRHDVLRPRIIHDSEVAFWYRQNLFLYVKHGTRLAAPPADFLPEEFNLVHREVLERYVGPPGVRAILRHLVPQLWKAVLSRVGPGRLPKPAPAREPCRESVACQDLSPPPPGAGRLASPGPR
jgi:hypothetical protein